MYDTPPQSHLKYSARLTNASSDALVSEESAASTTFSSGNSAERRPGCSDISAEKIAEPSNDSANLTDVSGLDLSGVDPSIRPQDDLFRHVNGAWIAHNASASTHDYLQISSFSELAEHNAQKLRTIIENITTNTDVIAYGNINDSQRIKMLYDSAINTAAIDSYGLEILQPAWDLIEKARTKDELIGNVGRLIREYNFEFPINLEIGPEPQNSTRYTFFALTGESTWSLARSSVGLSKNHLLQPEYIDIRKKYVDYLTTIFTLACLPSPQELAEQIMLMEQAIVQNIPPRDVRHSLQGNYRTYSLSTFQNLMPSLSLRHFISGKHIAATKLEHIVVTMPSYYRSFGKIWESQDIVFLKLWLIGILIRQNTDFLPAEFRAATFNFYFRTLKNVTHEPPRWKYGLKVVNHYLPDALGKLFVQQFFTPEAQESIVKLIENIKAAYHISFMDSWLSSETKNAAIAKLAHLGTTKVGYPRQWQNYSEISLGPDYYTNVLNISRWQHKQGLAKFDQPVNKSAWEMPVTAIDAYHDPASNEIVFPAGILQPPFFDIHADPAVNYGAIGAIIGHEISHGFDERGAQYNAHGNLASWWSPRDKNHFAKLIDQLIEQYNCAPLTGVPGDIHVNGQRTASENAADINGLTIAIRALRAHYNNGDCTGPLTVTQLQTVFYSWARIWRAYTTPEQLITEINNYDHSPWEIRANQTVKNIPEFYAAFTVEPSDREYLPTDQRVQFW